MSWSSEYRFVADDPGKIYKDPIAAIPTCSRC